VQLDVALTEMAEVRIIAVIGATGKQGRGVINALTFNKGPICYEVRPLTRSTTSRLAQAFSRDYPKLSLVEFDQKDTGSIQQCFEGCYGAFITTASTESSSVDDEDFSQAEIDFAERCLTAAKPAGIRHLIYPTFPSILKATKGAINVRRFETKHHIQRMIQASSIPSTILCPGPFYTDFSKHIYAYWQGDKLILSTPAAGNKRMGWADPAHDIGWFARATLEEGPEFMQGEEVPVCGQSIEYQELAGQLTAVTGIKAEYKACSIEEFEERLQGERDLVREDETSLGRWLAIAPDDMTCYGTIAMEALTVAQSKLRIKAQSWQAFLERTRWRGPPKGSPK